MVSQCSVNAPPGADQRRLFCRSQCLPGDQVLSGQGAWQGCGLNGGHAGVAKLLQVTEAGRGQRKLVEAIGCRGRGRGSHGSIIRAWRCVAENLAFKYCALLEVVDKHGDSVWTGEAVDADESVVSSRAPRRGSATNHRQ